MHDTREGRAPSYLRRVRDRINEKEGNHLPAPAEIDLFPPDDFFSKDPTDIDFSKDVVVKSAPDEVYGEF